MWIEEILTIFPKLYKPLIRQAKILADNILSFYCYFS